MVDKVADLSIDVTTNTASVELGFARLADSINSQARNINRSVDEINARMQFLGDTIKTITGIASVGVGVHMFSEMVTSTIEAQAHLRDLADQVGTTASKLSALIPAARLSGTSMDDISRVSERFSKALIDMQAGNAKSAQAFQTLGFNARDAAKFLADPVQGMIELSRAAIKFQADGARTAAVLELIGAGAHGGAGIAQLLPFMRELADQSSVQATLSDEQVEASHKLEISYRDLQLRAEDLRNVFASALVPELSRLLGLWTENTVEANGLRDAIKELSADGSFAIWLHEGAIGAATLVETLAVIGQAVYAFAGSVQVMIADLQSLASFGKVVATAGLSESALGDFKASVENRNQALEDANARWSHLWNDNHTAVSDSLKATLADMKKARDDFNAIGGATFGEGAFGGAALTSAFGGGPPRRPSVDTSGIVGKSDEAARALDRFRQMAMEANAQLAALGDGQKLTPIELALERLKASDVWAKIPDSIRRQIEAWKDVGAEAERAIDVQTRLTAVIAKVSDEAEGFGKNWAADFKALTDGFNSVDEKTGKARLSLEDYRALTEKLLQQQPFFKKQQEAADAFVKSVIAGIDALYRLQAQAAVGLANYTEQNKRIEEENALIGLDEVTRARILVLMDSQDLRTRLILAGEDELVKKLDEQVARRQAAVEAQIRLNEQVRLLQEAFANVADEGARFITDFVEHGSIAFRNLWQDFERWALEAFAKIASQTLVLHVVQSVAPSLAGVASQSLPWAIGSNAPGGLSALTSLFGSSSALGTFNATGAGVGFGTAGALGSFGMGLTSPISTLTTAFTQGAAAVGGFSAIVGAAIPVIGGIAAIAGLLGAFSHEPSQVRGQFGVSAGTTGFEDSAFTASKFGNLGFLDSATQYFSGQAAQAFNKMIGNALDAFAARYSPEQSARLASILQSTTFASAEGSYTTEDFIKTYGGPVLRQVIVSAFDVLDPALGSVAAAFTGTADEVAAFGNTLLGIYDATKSFGTEFHDRIVAALQGASQDSANAILAFVQITAAFRDSVSGIGDALQAFPGDIAAFIAALGGAQSALNAFAFINANFVTTAERVAAANTQLTTTFDSLGLQVPQTHAAFLQLLDAQIALGNTDTVQSLLGIAQAFITVNGTADDATKAINDTSEALAKLADLQAKGADFYLQNFASPDEQIAHFWDGVHDAWNKYGQRIYTITNGAFDHIPTTVSGLQALRATLSEVDGGIDLFNEVIGTAGESIVGLNRTLDDLAREAAQAAAAVNSVDVGSIIGSGLSLADRLMQQIETVISGSGGDFGAQLALRVNLLGQTLAQELQARADAPWYVDTRPLDVAITRLQQSSAAAQNELAIFIQLSAQYDTARAEQLVRLREWYDSTAAALAGNAAALAALGTIFNQRWAEIVNGVQAGVDHTAEALAKLLVSIRQFSQQSLMTRDQRDAANAAQIASDLSALGIAIPQTHAAWAALLAAVTDPVVGQRLLDDAQLWVEIHGTLDQATQAAQAMADQIANTRAGLNANFLTDAERIARATIDLAQGFSRFGVAVPQTHAQFLALIDGIDTSTASGQQMYLALTALADAFITVHGTAQQAAQGIGGASDAFARLRQDLLDYVQKITTSDLSPLSGAQRFAAAQASFRSDFAAAQGGDAQAFGRLTSDADTYLRLARDMFASGAQYTQAFAEVTSELTALGTSPNADPTATVAAAMPSNGPVSSQADIQQLQDVAETQVEAIDELKTTVQALLLRIAGDTSNTVVGLEVLHRDNQTDYARR